MHSTGSVVSEELAEIIGQNLRGGEVIELIGDLGSGKTTFVRGLARGMGSSEHVASPSFTISKVYGADKLTLHHFDFYRLKDPGLLAHELSEVLSGAGDVVVVEWADSVREVLPPERMTITIQPVSEQGRELLFHYPYRYAYLLQGLMK